MHSNSQIQTLAISLSRVRNEEIREDAAGTSKIYKMSIRDIATVVHEAMEKMVAKNDEDQWVLSGLRRNGWH